MKTPITIVTGYLGSGKTSLLRHVLDNADRRFAIVMNEFGELAIDSKIIKGKNVDMVELSGGCVCCSISGEFAQAVDEILALKPDHIIVETTGVVDPETLIYDIINGMPQLKLDSVVCVVDSHAIANYGIGQTARRQIESADILLVNKVDLIDKNRLLELQEELEKINPTAAKIRTIKCRTEPDLLFGMYTEKQVKHEKHDIEGVDTFIFITDRKTSREKFENFLKELKDIIRAKGFIIFEDGSYLFNYVNGRHDFEKFVADKTELVFIGEKLDKELLEKKLEVLFS